ncbi:MAG: LPS-assembly protein LptD, partial [Flavobacteriaceae bacterium]|nr:LPS-assembly protein LptD [Flavobacteriaceae bacterium]
SINQINDASALVNTLRSSISYSKTFEGEPQVNVTAALTHSQNTQTEQINMSLPNINANISRVYPFAPKVGTKKGIIDNINLQYNLSAENRIATTDSLFFKAEMFDSALFGARHTIPVNTNFKLLNYLSASIGGNYTEAWVFKTFEQRYDEELNNGTGGIVRDTVNGFQSYRTYNVGTSLGTTVYGTFNFGADKKIQKIRHVMRPSLSFGINPGFDQYYDEYVIPNDDPTAEDEVVTYSKFAGSLYGAPNELFSSAIGFDLSNTFEAKVRDRDTTATEAKTVTLLSNLQFRTSYDLAADSLKLSPMRVSGSIPIIKRLEFNFGGTLDPYALNNNNRRVDEWNIENGGSLFRLTGANVSMNYSFSSKDFQGDRRDADEITNETFQNGGRPDDLFGDVRTFRDDGAYATEERKDDNDLQKQTRYNFDIPWTLRFAYTMTYSNSIRQNEISSQSLSFSSNLELSPRWTVGVSSCYDFKQKGITRTQFRFERDLESWRMSFNYTPTGAFGTSWYFFIGIKSSVLSDIKYDKRRERDRNL